MAFSLEMLQHKDYGLKDDFSLTLVVDSVGSRQLLIFGTGICLSKFLVLVWGYHHLNQIEGC